MEPPCFEDIVTKLKTKYRWCDENSYRLAAKLPSNARCYVLFISNPEKKVSMLYQASDKPTSSSDFKRAAQKGIIWDYHVVVVCWCKEGWVVYDSSTTLGWAVPLYEWIRKSFAGNKQPAPMFKIIPREKFVKDFKSNRTDLNGNQIAPENWPSWPLINQTPGKSESNLIEYADMSGSNPPKGRAVNVQQLTNFFYPIE